MAQRAAPILLTTVLCFDRSRNKSTIIFLPLYLYHLPAVPETYCDRIIDTRPYVFLLFRTRHVLGGSRRGNFMPLRGAVITFYYKLFFYFDCFFRCWTYGLSVIRVYALIHARDISRRRASNFSRTYLYERERKKEVFIFTFVPRKLGPVRVFKFGIGKLKLRKCFARMCADTIRGE